MCHRLRGEGAAVGPDLDAAHLGGREKLLGNVLEPSREITAGYPAITLSLKSGATFQGILSNENAAGLTLRLPGGIEHPVGAGEIVKRESSNRSLMPDGLEAGLSPQEMANLLDYLMGTAPHAPPVIEAKDSAR